MKRLLLLLLIAVLLAGGTWLWRMHAAAPAPQAGSGSIRAVDFRNFEYRPDCLAGAPHDRVRTQGGEFELDSDDEKLFFATSVAAYGDLDGDGVEEAAILTGCNTGGSGELTEGLVYGLRGGRPVELARTEAGDRAFGGILGLDIEDGLLVVERYATDEDGPACCPRYIDRTRFRLQDGRLQQVGSAVRRDAPQE